MKKIISAILALVMLLGACLSLVACGEKSDAPEGMQIVRGSDALGYYFYGPAEWIVSNQGDIACTYVSKLNTTSVTFVEADMPEVSVGEYFAAEVAKYPAEFELKVTSEPKAIDFGNAESAMSAVFSYKYGDYGYTCMQVFVTNADRFYIFTYTASSALYDGEKTYYEVYLEKAESIIKEFKFVKVVPEEGEPAPEYPKDKDGYSLVSNKDIAHFDLYIPDTYSVDYSTSIVSVSREDGTSITVSEATYAVEMDSTQYWKLRLEELDRIADDVKATSEQKRITLNGADAVSYEYEYVLNGRHVKVYQVLIVTLFHGFVFTYTADAELYEANLDEAKDILSRMGF